MFVQSLSLLAAFALVTATAHAQPQPRKRPPPPPHAQPAPPPEHGPGPGPGGPDAPPPPPPLAMNPANVGTPAMAMESGTSDQPLLQPKTEVRHGFHFEAFVDAEAGLVNKDNYPTRGFTVNDAAMYLSKDFGSGLSALVDLPFATLSQGAVGGNSAFITFNAARAQAYAQFMRGPWQAKFGQFDTIFGYERNDSRDRFFANAGLVKSFLIPSTHVGVLGGYSQAGVTFRAMLADPSDSAILANQNPELGLQARYDAPAGFYGQVGFLTGDANPKGSNTGSNQLIDVALGMTMDRLSGGVYFDDRKVAGVDKHANGFGIQAGFAQSPDLSFGGRVEYVSDIGNYLGVTGVKNAFGISAGPSYRWLPDVTLRGDLDFASISPYLGDNVSLFGAQSSLVLGF